MKRPPRITTERPAPKRDVPAAVRAENAIARKKRLAKKKHKYSKPSTK